MNKCLVYLYVYVFYVYVYLYILKETRIYKRHDGKNTRIIAHNGGKEWETWNVNQSHSAYFYAQNSNVHTGTTNGGTHLATL